MTLTLFRGRLPRLTLFIKFVRMHETVHLIGINTVFSSHVFDTNSGQPSNMTERQAEHMFVYGFRFLPCLWIRSHMNTYWGAGV